MPFIIDTGASQFTSGLKRQLIIDIANKRTGKIAETKGLNLGAEYLDALQSLCMERNWWWRKRTVALETIPQIAVYDMADPESPINQLDCQRMVKATFWPTSDQQSAVNPPDKSYAILTPIFDDEEIQAKIEDDVSTGPPQNYFLVPGSTTAIQLWPTSDDVYKCRFTFWAVPGGTVDALPDLVPLVPANLQRLLTTRLEMNFLKAAVKSEGGAAYVSALQVTQADYQKELANAGMQRDFADGRIREFANTEHAIRSSH